MTVDVEVTVPVGIERHEQALEIAEGGNVFKPLGVGTGVCWAWRPTTSLSLAGAGTGV